MTQIVLMFVSGGSAILGAILLIAAQPLSLRYNEWTTNFRERYPNINPPPTPQWRERNVAVMIWLIRIVGALALVASALALIRLISSW